MKQVLCLLALLAACGLAFADWEIEEDFESGTIPAGWTAVDQDGDGNAWRPLSNASHAHSGNYVMFCDNFFPHENEDWLILPQIQIEAGDSLHFYARSWAGTENLAVKLSTSDTAVKHFNHTLLEMDDLPTTYHQYSVSLADYAGQAVYVAFYWECDTYAICLDDVSLGSMQNVQPVITLPDSFSFIQGQSLQADFADYIQNAEPETATLSVSGNTHITVAIDGFDVTMTCAEWSGDESLSFTVDNGVISAGEDVPVTVVPTPTVELGAVDIITPTGTVFMNHALYPTFTFVNDGTGDLTDMFTLTCLIIDSGGEVFYDQAGAYGSTVASGQTVEYAFSVPCTPAITGQYTVTFGIEYTDENPDNNTIIGTFNVLEHFGAGGPDEYGYHWIDSATEGGPAYDWIDISATGQSAITYGVPSFSGDDNFSECIPIGFDFPFYGYTYSTFNADTNGELLLEADNMWYEPYPDADWPGDGNVFNWSYPIPGYAQMPALIAVFWDDLEADEGVGDIYFQTFGAAPNRYCVVQWHNFRFHAGTGLQDYLNFEVILRESGEIVMQYQSVATGQTGSAAPHDYGQSSTVAIQNEAADIGLCYLFEIVEGSVWQGVTPEGNLLYSGLAISFLADVDTQPPVITHEQVGNTFNSNFTLQATIVDLSPLEAVNLHYNVGGDWQQMTSTGMAGENVYTFDLADIPAGSLFQYYFEAADTLANTATLPAGAPQECFSFRILPTEDVTVLLCCSGRQDYEHIEQPAYEAALQELNYTYDVYDWQEYGSYRFPDQYTSIIAYANTGTASEACDTLSMALVEFMDSGTADEPKGVFFASDGFAFSQGGTPTGTPLNVLLTAYFRTSYIGTGIGGGTNGLGGPDNLQYANGTILCLSDSPVGDPGTETDVYANSPDCLFEKNACPDWYADIVQNPEIGSHNAYAFEDGPINGQAYLYHGVCATWIDNIIYRGFYFSFDFSQISSPDERTAFLGDALDWFGEDVAESGHTATPASLVLLQNAPNPFNPVTTIRFSLPQTERVELNVYDVKGRRVRTLVGGTMAAGTQSVVWNGTDDTGRACASGVYFYRLKANDRVFTKKMLLLK